MKKGFVWMGAALAAVSVLGVTGVASASSHREAPAISKDPAADNTDVWAWSDGAAGTALHVVAAYNPFEVPEGGPNYYGFSDDVLYEVHLTRGAVDLKDVVKYQIKFSTTPIAKVPGPYTKDTALGGGVEFFSQLSGQTQTYTVTKVTADGTATPVITGGKVAPPNIGGRTNQVAYKFASGATYEGTYGAPLIATGGSYKSWAGPRDDGFYVDLGGFFDLANLRSTTATGGVDGLAGFNCHAIAIDIPIAEIPAGSDTTSAFKDRVGVWASASRRKVSILRNDGTTSSYGPWVQVSRLGLPLINEVIIGLQDKDKFNRTTPETDVTNFGAYILSPVLPRDAAAVGTYGAGGPPAGVFEGRTDIVSAMNILAPVGETTATPPGFPLSASGDVLRVELKQPPGFPNGRPIPGNADPFAEQADVTDILASIVLLTAAGSGYPGANIKDGVSKNDAQYLPGMPYLPSPWEGRAQGISARLGATIPPVTPTP